jgi:hypothetical protein
MEVSRNQMKYETAQIAALVIGQRLKGAIAVDGTFAGFSIVMGVPFSLVLARVHIYLSVGPYPSLVRKKSSPDTEA